MKNLLFLISVFFTSTWGISQVDCISNYSGTFNNSGFPKRFIEYNGWLYFTAQSDETGYELWRTNGNGGVTELFADIGLLNSGSDPDYFAIFESELYFTANNFIDGIQIWKTNGTVEGTVVVTNFAYPPGITSSSGIGSLKVFNNQLFFVRSSLEYGAEIWKTDGTMIGTSMLKDINIGTNGSVSYANPYFRIMGSNLYFFADDALHGKELWKTDGTEPGTALVKDINVGATQSSGASLTLCNNLLYFTASNGTNGAEIWKSDGTEAGTSLISDINPGSANSDPKYLTVSNDKVFFSAVTSAANRELWITDGTIAGTYLVKDISPGSTSAGDPMYLYAESGTLYFAANNNSNGDELWKSDGTNAGTVMVKDIRSGGSSDPRYFHYYNGYIYFQANDGVMGQELWRTDGTTIGTTVVANINPGGVGSLPSNFISYNGNIIFQATKNSTSNYELWITNGNSAGTINLRNIYTADNLDDLASDGGVFKNKLYFDAAPSSSARKIYSTSGTAASTSLFSNIPSSPRNYYIQGNRMFFHGNAGVYRTNGTTAGTSLVASISYPAEPTYLDATLNGKYAYFTTNSTATVINLYVCDSNSAPVLVKSISNASMNDTYNPFECVTMNNVIYFSMTTVSSGRELWRSDGTNAGTYLLKNIAAGSASGNPTSLTVVGNRLYFAANDGTNGIELWQSDGTGAGTIMLKDIIIGSVSSSPKNLAAFNDTLYFSADNGINGIELWKSDGTAAGTSLYMDIAAGSVSSKPMNLTANFNGLYFSAFTENEGRELWIKKQDIIPQIVIDLGPGKFSGNPSNLKVIDNLLYLTANDEVHGYEPYVTLGSECSTSMIADANPGDKGSTPLFFGNVNGKIVMSADTDLNNFEVYSFNAPFQHTDTIYACQKYYWAAIDDTLETSGLYSTLLTSYSGCDSIINLQLTIGQPSNTIQTVMACSSYTWIDGITYTSSNSTATHTLSSITSCDSLVQLNLIINSPTNSFDTVVTCNSYFWGANNSVLTSSGDYSTVLTAINGCDSTVFLNLTVHEPSESILSVSVCGSFTWVNGVTYTTSTNTPTFHYTNIHGCDSMVTLNLTLLNTSGNDTQTACDSFTWIDGNTYTSSTNLPTFVIPNSNGCDSVITLNLTILNNSGTDFQTACQSYTWIDGNTYTSSTNSPTFTFTNSNGCDSVVTLNLTILNNSGIDIQSACQSYTWINGVTYTSSTNSPTHVLSNTQGCDSTVTLNLIVSNPSSSTTTITECGEFTWTNGITYMISGTYTQTLTNVVGCDSIAILQLTINNSSAGTDIQTACDSYTWIDNVTYSSSTNTPTYTLQNAAGCDSIVTLNLTINNSSASTTTITACDEYIWTDGNTYTTSGTHTQTLTNVNGCDSVATLDLIINNPTSSTFNASSCGTYFWELAQTTYSFPGSFPFTVMGSNGCDSVVTLSLVLGFVPTAEITHDGNGTLTATGGIVLSWIDCATNMVIQGESGSTFTPATNGSYRVVISDGVSSCEDTSACFVLNNVSINTQQLLELSIYPNPTNDLLTVKFEGTNAQYTIYDAQGKLIRTSNIVSGGTVSLRDVQTGVYFFELMTEGKHITEKIIKH